MSSDKLRRLVGMILCFVLCLGLISGSAAADDPQDKEQALAAYMQQLMKPTNPLCPVKEEHVKKIESLEQGSREDTWAIYIYMNGSDLEWRGENRLSTQTETLISPINARFAAEGERTADERIEAFEANIAEKGSTMPDAYSADGARDGSVAPNSGSGSGASGLAGLYLEELMQVELGDNIKIVVQPGGSRAWSIPDIDPNRTQRFEICNGYMEKVYEGELENMGDPDTLTNFLSYCRSNYPADRTVVIMWDHGGASRGFGWDMIYTDDNLSLDELRRGFAAAFEPDDGNPPIDLVYYNACLLSGAELMNAMRGICDYMLCFEEVGYAGVPFYTDPFRKLSAHPEMHPAQFARLLVDNFVPTVAQYSVDYGMSLPTGMTIVDAGKAADVYDAYCELAGVLLDTAIENNVMLAVMDAAAKQSAFFALEAYKKYNTIDLCDFMDGLMAYVPEEARAVKDAVDEAVLYYRGSAYNKENGGISIYYPAHIETTASLDNFLAYIDEISRDESINALYYYKVAGCMTDEMELYAASRGFDSVPTIDYSILDEFEKLPLNIDEQLLITLDFPMDMLLRTSDLYLQMARYGEDGNVYYLGQHRNVGLDMENGRLYEDFEGQWVSINGVNLPMELAGADMEYAKFRCPMLHNGVKSYLLLSYCYETDVLEISGIRRASEVADRIDRNIILLKEGDVLAPIYTVSDLSGNVSGSYTSEEIIYHEGMTADHKAALEDGRYCTRIVLEDLRSDRYYSAITDFVVENGIVTHAELAPDSRMSPVAY